MFMSKTDFPAISGLAILNMDATRVGWNRWALSVILAPYVVLGLAYNISIPPFEAPDEPQHYAYAEHLVVQGRLPVLEVGEPPSESHQPPLYYAAVALLLAPWLPVDSSSLLNPNPHWGYDLSTPGEPRNANRFSHGYEVDRSDLRAVVVVHGLRLISLVCGIGTLTFCYAMVRSVFPQYPSLAFGATALVAFNPQFIFVSSIINNDALAACLGSAILLLLINIQRDTLSFGRGAFLGLLLGLGILAKLTTIVLVVPVVGTLTYLVWRHSRRVRWSSLFMVAFVFSLVAGWWFLRNQALYGDLLGYSRWRAVWDSRSVPLTPVGLIGQFPTVWRSLWVNFGWGNVVADQLVYSMLGALVMVCICGWLFAWLRPGDRLSIERRQRISLVILLLAIISGFTGLLAFESVATAGSNARYMFVVLPALSLLLFIGLCLWFPMQWWPATNVITITAGILFCAFVLLEFLRPVYAAAPRILLGDLPSDTQRLDWQYGDSIKLVGYGIDTTRIAPNQELAVTLYWQPLAAMNQDYSVFIHLLGPNQESWGSVDSFPGMGSDPTRGWRPGKIIEDHYRLRVSADARKPSLARLEVGLYDYPTGQRLPVRDQAGVELALTELARVSINGVTSSPPPTSVITNADFGDSIRLIGYSSGTQPDQDGILLAHAGDAVNLTLIWQAIAKPGNDYTRFAHLVIPGGAILAQQDIALGNDVYPSGLWIPQDWVTDTVTISVPDELTLGAYQVIVGLYDLRTMQRLTLPDGADHLQLIQVLVR